MPKESKRRPPDTSTKRFHTSQPWVAQHHSDRSEIRAYSEASCEFETVLVVCGTSGCSAEAMAAFVLGIVNEIILSESIMLRAMTTMQDFLIENDFNPKVEKPVVDLVERIKRTYGLK
jgi:hypothetical protein